MPARVERGDTGWHVGAGRDKPVRPQVSELAHGREGADEIGLFFFGHEQRGGHVDRQCGATGQAEKDEAKADQGGINVEVLCDTAAYAEEAFVGGAASEAFTGNGKAAPVAVLPSLVVGLIVGLVGLIAVFVV